MEKSFKRQLHIAMLSLHSCPCGKLGSRYTGGMNIYIRNMAAELIRQGHIVDIFTCSHDDDADCGLQLPGGYVNLIHIQADDFAAISESNLDRHVSDLVKSIIDHSLTHGLRYDIIHSHYWLSGMVGELLKNVWGIPHVTMFHTLGKIKNETGLGKVEPPYRIEKEHSIISSSDLIIASTGREKIALVKKYDAVPGKISIIPCGVNPSQFRPINKDLARRICNVRAEKAMLFVGRADPVKGLDNLLQAVSLLKDRDDFQLIVIGGDNTSMQGVKQTISASGKYAISDRIHLVGPVPHDQMYLYYNAADFCVIPSYYESFSLVALEAIACSTPILATDVGEVRDISHRCPLCHIIESNEPCLLADNIDRLFNLADGCTKACPDNLPIQYTWEHITGRIVEFHFTLIDDAVPFKQDTLQCRPVRSRKATELCPIITM